MEVAAQLAAALVPAVVQHMAAELARVALALQAVAPELGAPAQELEQLAVVGLLEVAVQLAAAQESVALVAVAAPGAAEQQGAVDTGTAGSTGLVVHNTRVRGRVRARMRTAEVSHNTNCHLQWS